jgi:hypothetical protein
MTPRFGRNIGSEPIFPRINSGDEGALLAKLTSRNGNSENGENGSESIFPVATIFPDQARGLDLKAALNERNVLPDFEIDILRVPVSLPFLSSSRLQDAA